MEINARKRETKLVENNRILAQLETVLQLHKQGGSDIVEAKFVSINHFVPNGMLAQGYIYYAKYYGVRGGFAARKKEK